MSSTQEEKNQEMKCDRLDDMVNGYDVENDSKIASGHDDVKKAKKSTRVGSWEKEYKKYVKKLDNQYAKFAAENLLPQGRDLKEVAGVDVNEQDAGDVFQFLEFCAAFGKILEVEKGQPELVLWDLYHRRTASRGNLSQADRFHIKLLSILQNERKKSAKLGPSSENEAWFHAVKKILCDTESSLKEFLEKDTGYESLDPLIKLRILNFLCDECLGTQKLRNWIEERSTELAENVKEGRKRVATAKKEEESLKQRKQDDIVKATAAKNGDHLSISELEAIDSQYSSEETEARDNVLKSKDILVKSNQTCDAVRTEPVFIGRSGDAYWKLNCFGKSHVYRQDIGKGDPLSLGGKWSAVDAQEEEMIKKHADFLKKQERSRKTWVKKGWKC